VAEIVSTVFSSRGFETSRLLSSAWERLWIWL
jgi:hypothetical protein